MEKDLVGEEVEVLKVVLEVEDQLVVQEVQEHSGPIIIAMAVIINREYYNNCFLPF